MVPVIDMQEITELLEEKNDNEEILHDFGKKLLSDLSSFGLVQLMSHGIPIDLFKRGFDSSRQFFNLEDNVKNKYAIDHLRFHGYVCSGKELVNANKDLFKQGFDSSRQFFNLEDNVKNKYGIDHQRFHGYISSGKELFNSNKVSYECREAFNIAALDDTILPNKDDSPEFGQSFIEMSGLFDKLVRRIFIALALALGKDSDYLLKMYKKQFTDQNFTTLRTLFYPAITENEYSENTGVNIVRLGEHTDYGPMTLLYQDNIGGLEVKCPKTSKWIGITPNENAIILNMGDLFEILTSGHIPAALHRVSTSKEMAKKDRQSMAFFVHHDHGSTVTPIENFETHPINAGKAYSAVQSDEYVRGRLNDTIKKKRVPKANENQETI